MYYTIFVTKRNCCSAEHCANKCISLYLQLNTSIYVISISLHLQQNMYVSLYLQLSMYVCPNRLTQAYKNVKLCQNCVSKIRRIIR